MKKENIVAISMAIPGGIAFSIGMVMALVAEWHTLVPGIILGAVGLCTLLLIIPIYRKIAKYPPIHADKKVVFTYILGIFGALLLGIGMCFALQVFPVSTLISYAIGIPVGLMGIVIVILTPLLYQSVFPKTKKME